MTNPWDNEPTPITNQAVIDTHGHWTFELRDRMADLERRLRHADRLLELCAGNTLFASLFESAEYVGIHKNAAGRITLVLNNGEGSVRTSCSKKGFSFTEKLIECRDRLQNDRLQNEMRDCPECGRMLKWSGDVAVCKCRAKITFKRP